MRSWLRARSRRVRDRVRGLRPQKHPHSFEDLCGPGEMVFDPGAVGMIDEDAGRLQLCPVTDVTGRTLFERRFASRIVEPGEHRLPEEFEVGETVVILANTGWVVSRQGWLVPISIWRGLNYLPRSLLTSRPLPQRLRAAQRLPGVTLNCMSDWADRVYGHCLWESVFRILLHWDLHGSFDKVDQILAPPFSQRVLRLISPDVAAAAEGKFVTAAERDLRFVCEAVRISPHPARIGSISPRQIEVLRRHVRHRDSGGGARIFRDRTGSDGRVLRNRHEVLETVRRAGYQVVSLATTPNLQSVCHQATHVAGVHGSDLADIVFMQPGSRVLELTPTDQVLPYFRAAGGAAGLDYRTLFIDSETHRMWPRGPSPAAVTIDCKALAQALAE